MIDGFLVRELLRPPLGGRSRIGWVVPLLRPYATVMASTRMRAYDAVLELRRQGLPAELYRPGLGYRAVVFQKAFLAREQRMARRLRGRGTRLLLDINVDYVAERPDPGDAERRAHVQTMLGLVDGVVVSSGRLADVYAPFAREIDVVVDPVPDAWLDVRKEHRGTSDLRLLYCGYAAKAGELRHIEPLLHELREESGTRLLLVCEKDPSLDWIPYEFVRYDQRRLAEILRRGDVKIAPRDLSAPFNLAHSFAKIGFPMAVGLPVVASPMPSYEGSPARLCRSDADWARELRALIGDAELRDRLGREGQQFVREHHATSRVMRKYADILNRR